MFPLWELLSKQRRRTLQLYRLSAPVCNGFNSRPDAMLDRSNEQVSLSIVSAVTHAGVTGPRLGAFSAGGAVSKPCGLIIIP